MIQIKIIHYEDGTHTVSEVNEVTQEGTVCLSKFNLEENKIDFSVLKDRVNESIIVNHYNGDDFDYTAQKVLIKVGTDENGIGFITYQ